jgi:tetratricopeptide (TPR) repeat protein
VQTLRAGGEAAVRKRQEEAEALAARLVAAEDHYRAGEMALRRNQYDAAVGEFDQAVKLNPDEAEHHALLAWATWCAAADKTAAARAARERLDKASQMSPRNPIPHLLLGKIARALGDDEVAARHIRRCLEVSPGHGEASSELRLIEARLGRPPDDPKKPGGGLFSRLKR